MSQTNRYGRASTLRLLTLAMAVIVSLGAGSTAVQADTVALVGATVHPVSSDAIESGVVIIDGREIVTVGPAGTAVPDGAEVVDLSGKHVYPGFVDSGSVIGLLEVGSVRGTDDTEEIGDINSHLRAEVAFNADSFLLPPTMSGGVLTAHIYNTGGLLTGTSAVMRLEGWNWEDMTLASPIGMHLNYPDVVPASQTASGSNDSGSSKKILETLDETLADARAYGTAKTAAEAGDAPEFDADPRLEALLPVVDGSLPLFVHVESRSQIASALDWLETNEFSNAVLVADPDVRYLADRIADAGYSVILDSVLTRPERDWEPYDAAYGAAAALHEAGVRFAINGGSSPAMARNLPFHAAMAAAFGLPKDEALASITLRPAEILGVEDRVGSLESGKEATLIVTDGDPLEIITTIERAWIAGSEIDLSKDRHKQLYEKYDNRPRPSP